MSISLSLIILNTILLSSHNWTASIALSRMFVRIVTKSLSLICKPVNSSAIKGITIPFSFQQSTLFLKCNNTKLLVVWNANNDKTHTRVCISPKRTTCRQIQRNSYRVYPFNIEFNSEYLSLMLDHYFASITCF